MPDKKKALVVDDQAMNRTFIKGYLSTRGYEAEVAEDGLKALEICKTKTFDLVFTDIEMPNMNGIEFLRSAKKIPGYTPIPFVVLSTIDDAAMKAKAMSFGAFYYMVKPFTDEKMSDLFNNLR